MRNFIFAIIAFLNLAAWVFNWMLSVSRDKSGAGMVMLLSIPSAIFLGLVSLIIIGFML